MLEPKIALHSLTVPIPRLPAGLAGMRIVHISDTHFRRWGRIHQRVQDILRSLEFDYLFLTGDYCVHPESWKGPARLMRSLLEPVAGRFPCYAVLGNHDLPAFAEKGDLPVVFLRNESVTLQHAGVPFELVGLDQSHHAGEQLSAAFGPAKRHDFTILLAHYPSTVFRLPPGRVDLQLSGHTHGGQIRLPLLGCIWPNDRISRHMARGLHAVGGSIMHISPGIGVSRPLPVRFNCPSEVTILILHAVPTTVIQPSVDETHALEESAQVPIA